MTEATLKQPASAQVSAFGRILRIGTCVLVIAALAVTNVLTLVDEQFHNKAYGWLETIIQTVSDGSVLGNSPTQVRKHDIEVATSALVKNNDRLSRKALELTADAIAIAAEIKVIKGQKVALEAAANVWEQRHRQVEDVLQKNRSSTQRLSKSVIHRLARNTSRNVTGLVGKSVPYLGIAVTLAMTSLDVIDACDTVREMNQLST
jgi:hypothetical protein